MTDQEDSNWAGYVAASSASAKTSFSSVSGSWTDWLLAGLSEAPDNFAWRIEIRYD